MNVFTCLFDFATKGAVRIKFHLFNFFSHLLILGLTDNFTTKGILIAYASFIINLFCGEFLFFRITKALKGLERLIYANQHLEDLEEQNEIKTCEVNDDGHEHNSEQEESAEEDSESNDSSEEEQSSDDHSQTIRERICSEINF